MIPLRRTRTEEAVHRNFRGAKRIELNLRLLKKKRDGELEAGGKSKWDSGVWKEAKDQLLTETNNKCAYCETPTRVIAYGDVEHFRPKSVYWWLAYCYENYLASCTVCNQEYKKDRFEILDTARRLSGPQVTAAMTEEELEELAPTLTPDPVSDGEGMPFSDFEAALKGETCLLVNPYHEDPSEYFAYKPILETKEVVVVPTKAEHERVVKAAERVFGINRKELMDLRFQRYSLYMTLRHTLNDPCISAGTKAMCESRLREMAQDDAPYAGMIRHFAQKNLSDLPWNFNVVA